MLAGDANNLIIVCNICNPHHSPSNHPIPPCTPPEATLVTRHRRRQRRAATILMRGFHHCVSVPPFPYRRCPLQKYVRITFIRNNSVRTPQLTSKITFSVSVSSSLPFIQDRVLFFHICRSYALELRPLCCAGNSAPWLLGLPRTGPSSNGMNGLYGHGFYGNGTASATATGYGMLEIRHNKLQITSACSLSTTAVSISCDCAVNCNL